MEEEEDLAGRGLRDWVEVEGEGLSGGGGAGLGLRSAGLREERTSSICLNNSLSLSTSEIPDNSLADSRILICSSSFSTSPSSLPELRSAVETEAVTVVSATTISFISCVKC